MTIIQLLLFIGVTQGIFLGVVLWTANRGPKTANRILGSIVLIFAVSILMHVLGHGRSTFDLKFHDSFLHIGFLVITPLLFLYIRVLTIQNFLWTYRELLHFIPAGLGCFFLFLNAVLPFADNHYLIEVIGFSNGIQAIPYIILSYRHLQKYSTVITEAYSSIEKINLRWIRFLLGMFSLTWIVALILDAFKNELVAMDFFWLFMSLFIYLMGYFGLRQPEIFSGVFTLDQTLEPAGKRKYEKSTLTPEKSEEYIQRLQQLMRTERPFKDRDITLPALADKMALTTHELSQLINERLNKNFFEFINSYRVDEAKAMMANRQSDHLSIAALAYDAGFNSISAFNTAFKKYAGITPSQFRKNCLSDP